MQFSYWQPVFTTNPVPHSAAVLLCRGNGHGYWDSGKQAAIALHQKSQRQPIRFPEKHPIAKCLNFKLSFLRNAVVD